MYSHVKPSPTSGSSTPFIGIAASVVTPVGNAQNQLLHQAVSGQISYKGSGTLTYATGLDGEIYDVFTGTVQNAFGAYLNVQILNGGTINNGYGAYINSPSNNGGTFGAYYGLYIGTPTVAVTNYALYSQGGNNYFGGLITAAGSIIYNVRTITSSTTLLLTDSYILSNGATTITLPSAGAGQTYNLKNISTNPVSIVPTSGTIDGASSAAINTQYTALELTYDGTNWFIF